MGPRAKKSPFRSWNSGVTKYKNVRISHAGYAFASKGEAALFDELKLREKAGELKDIKCQTHVYLTLARINYIADFSAIDVKENCPVWFEFKGFETDVWKIKKRLWKYYGPGALFIYGGNYTKIRFIEAVIPTEIDQLEFK